MYKFKIFTKVKKIYFTNNLIIYSILLIGFIPLWIRLYILKNDDLSYFEEILLLISVSSLIVGIIFKFFGISKYKTLKGIFDKDLVFENDKIIIGAEIYLIADIKKIELNSEDFVGALRYYNQSDFNGALSNGEKNILKLKLNNDDILEFNFQQNDKYEMQNIREQLIIYYTKGKFNFLNLIDALKITDYDEIQKFKQTLPPTAVLS